MPTSTNVLISHAHDEKTLAEAWKALIDTATGGLIKTWFSSDTQVTGGMDIGKEWRQQLYDRLSASDFILAIQTPTSAGRPWIMWECGVASGIDKERGLIPVVYSMGRGDLSNPLSSYQVYAGEDADQVVEILKRLAIAVGFNLQTHFYTDPLRVYQQTINLHRPRKALRPEQMSLWRDRAEQLIQSGRVNEILGLRQSMYASLGKPFQPVEPTVHETFSRILLEQKHYKEAIEETDYALAIVDNDVQLIHRKALASIHLHDFQTADKLINHLYSIEDSLHFNSEIASLEGRVHREKWTISNDNKDLDQALAAYLRAYEADRTQYYPGVNAGSLALIKGDFSLSDQIFGEVFAHCKKLQQNDLVSYWVDFTAGEVCLGRGEIDAALNEYRNGLNRFPRPSYRDCESAARGAQRMITARKSDPELFSQIRTLLL